MKNLETLKLNRFRPAEYKKENLINFENRNIWMHGVESNRNPELTGLAIFAIFCACTAIYFIFR